MTSRLGVRRHTREELCRRALAAREGGVLVSHDQTTMRVHFGRFIMAQSGPGLMTAPQHIPPASAAKHLMLIWDATEAEEWTNRVVYLHT